LSLCILNKGDTLADESDGAEQMGAIENEARFAAERIRTLLDARDAAGNPKYKPDDIVILFRAHGPQHIFEKRLRLLNIPYASEAVGGFFSGGPVNDLMSALRLAAYPRDTAAYAEMLRAPFVGLSLQSAALCLAVFNHVTAGSPHPPPFSSEALPRLTAPEQARFLHGRDLYGRLRARASTETLCALVSELWYAEGYRYETEWNPQTAVYRELYDYLFHLAAKADEEGMGLAAFTDSVRKLRESGGHLEEIDIPLERSGAVRLMTIHKSKGLEFPVVFLCCCGSHGAAGGVSDDVFRTESGGISFNPPLPRDCAGIPGIRRNFFSERSSRAERRKRCAELRRLLYVAMTRAERELFITGSFNLGEGEGGGELSLRLKSAVEGKRGDGDAADRIAADTIIDNDTFFGLLLPAIADHIPPEGLGAAPSFFSLESIPVYADDSASGYEQAGLVFPNTRRGLARFLEKAAPYYQALGDADTITTPHIENKHRTPTSFRETAETGAPSVRCAADEQHSGGDAADIFGGIEGILGRFAAAGEAEASFSPADFGTIAHGCVEALMRGVPPAIPAGLGGRLSPAEADTLLAAGTALAARFLESPLGRAAQSAPLRRGEYRFRSLYGNAGSAEHTFINGTIDLLFADARTLQVVDFKTDKLEAPGEHAAQMAFYYRAAMDLLGAAAGKECRVWLYYLRSGHAVDMTEAAKGLAVETLLAPRRPVP
jgi:ATP-dependent helicase/nuclease subunit A